MTDRLILPVLPLRDVVLFPGVTAPIGAGRPMTIKAIEAALATPDKFVFAVAQRENVEQVASEGLYRVGTIARIGQLQRGMSGMQLLLHGERRGMALQVTEENGHLVATVRGMEDLPPVTIAAMVFFPLGVICFATSSGWANWSIMLAMSPAWAEVSMFVIPWA